MSEFYFAGEVAEATGVPMQTINEWCSAGIAGAAVARPGSGRHRVFRALDAVALAYAHNWRRSGLGMERVREVAAYIAAFSEAELRAELRAGRRVVFPLPAAPRLVATDAELPGPLDLERVYADVTRGLTDRRPSAAGGSAARG